MDASRDKVPVACVPSALTKQERDRTRELRVALGLAVAQVTPLTSGYAYAYKSDSGAFDWLAEWIPMERKCCPFLTFDLQWAAGEPQPSLTLTGPAGTKDFLQAEMPELPRE